MDFCAQLSEWIDRWTDRLGRTMGWITLAMVVVGSFNSVARYVDGYRGRHQGVVASGENFMRFSSNSLLELQWYLFSLVFLLGAAYALRHNAHVRVDLLYGRMSRQGKAWIDLVGTLVLMLPFSAFTLWVSWPSVRNSWQVREISPDPGGLARYPIKTVILVAFGVLILQGISEVLKRVVILWGDSPDAEPESSTEGPLSHAQSTPFGASEVER